MEQDIKKEEFKKGDVKLLEKFGFLGFSCSTNIVFNFKSLYYLTFLTMILKIPVGIAGFMLTLGTVWDAVNDPLIALFCSNRKFKNGEKVRPYALWCCVPWAISIVLLFVNFHLTQSLTVIIGIIIYFIFEALYTFLCMPYNSMAALSTKNDADRKSINAFRSLGGTIGSGIGAVAILPIMKLFGGLQDHKVINASDSKALLLTALVMGVICILGSLFHYFTAKERVKGEIEDDSHLGFFQAYKMLFKCKSWIYNMCYIIGYGIIVALVMQNVNYYAAYVLGDSNKATPILAAYLVVAILTGIFTPLLDKKIGRRNTMIIAIAVMVIGKIPFIFAPEQLFAIYINSATVGFGATATFIMFNTNRNNIADILEAQNDRRIDTLVAGGDNLISKLAEALTIQAMTFVLSLTGYDAELELNQTAQTITAIEAFLGWVPMLVTLAMTYFAFKIDIPKELEESKAKQAERRQAAHKIEE